jgi:hypothetical protein
MSSSDFPSSIAISREPRPQPSTGSAAQGLTLAERQRLQRDLTEAARGHYLSTVVHGHNLTATGSPRELRERTAQAFADALDLPLGSATDAWASRLSGSAPLAATARLDGKGGPTTFEAAQRLRAEIWEREGRGNPSHDLHQKWVRARVSTHLLRLMIDGQYLETRAVQGKPELSVGELGLPHPATDPLLALALRQSGDLGSGTFRNVGQLLTWAPSQGGRVGLSEIQDAERVGASAWKLLDRGLHAGNLAAGPGRSTLKPVERRSLLLGALALLESSDRISAAALASRASRR